jgi:hypothetical protein
MKKIRYLLVLCFIAILFLFAGITNAQSNSLVQQSDMKREKFRLAIVETNGINNGVEQTVLKKEQLQLLLSDNQFNNYKRARRCYHASIPLLSLSACGLVGTTVALGFGIFGGHHYDPDRPTMNLGLPFAMFFAAGTLPFLIPGVILITHSTKKLNRIAENYNIQHYSSFYQSNIQINFSFTSNGIRMRLSF